MATLGGIQRRLRHRLLGHSQLDMVIPPEVIDDSFSLAIREIASQEDVHVVLEIGASSGQGSTASLIAAMRNREFKSLHCLELSVPRFKKLQRRYADLAWVHCYNLPSVPVAAMPTAADVAHFLQAYPMPSGVREVQGWLQQDIDYMNTIGPELNGIAIARQAAGVETFDLVLIDGSEFSGEVELIETYGAKYVLLDDVATFKNRHSYDRLADDADYKLIAENWDCRNGFAAFERLGDRR